MKVIVRQSWERDCNYNNNIIIISIIIIIIIIIIINITIITSASQEVVFSPLFVLFVID